MEHPMPTTQTRSRRTSSEAAGVPATPAVAVAKNAGGTPALPGEGTPALQGTQMSGAEMVIRALADQGVEHVFGYPGGAVLPIYDALFHQEKVRHILVRHEQGAVHAAEGYARSTGKGGW